MRAPGLVVVVAAAAVCALLGPPGVHRADAACTVSSATLAPEYPAADNSFDTSDLVSEAAELVALRITPNELPNGYDASENCPYDDGDLVAWEATATWSGDPVPGDGDDVTLPEDTRVLVSGCSIAEGVVFGTITIPASSELIFADEDIEFDAQGFLVEGKLTLGSETCRLHSQIVITLHGERPATVPAAPSYKGIAAVEGGTVDVHGSIFHPTWSRLAATAATGDTQIYLQHRVNWQPGQTLVLTGTEIKDSRDWHRNEVREIQAVERSGPFARITLTAPLNYTHYGGVEYQGEVGLLSRNIVIQGDEASEPTDTEDDVCEDGSFGTYPCENKWLTGFGGHTMAIGEDATIRFEGVQLYRMGQTNVLARYPWHVHHVGENGFRSYIKHSSIYHSFYRCASVHGTNSTLVQDNVAYDVIGHCYYIAEDGVEENSTVAYNLGAHVHFMEYPRTSSDQYMPVVKSYANLTQPADVTASPFYITRAYHRIFGNAASGGYAGFAIVRMPEPTMNYRNVAFPEGTKPENRPFIEFDGNSCHGGGYWWNRAPCIYVGGRLEHESQDSDVMQYNPGREVDARETKCLEGASVVDCELVFTNTKIFLSNWGINHWGKRGRYDGLEVHDTYRPVGVLGDHFFTNLLFVCRTHSFVPERLGSSGYRYYEQRWFSGHVMYELYDTHQHHIIDGLTVRNCGDPTTNSPIWRLLTHSDRFVPELIQITRNVVYESGNDFSMLLGSTISDYLSVSGCLANFIDADGSVHGERNSVIGPRIIGAAREGIEWWRLDSNCIEDGDYFACNKISAATGNRRGVASFAMDFDPDLKYQFDHSTICGNGNRISCPRVGSVMHLGVDGDPDQVGLPIRANAVVTGPSNGLAWLVLFDAGSPVSISFKRAQIDEDDTLIVAIPYPPETVFDISYVAAYWCWDVCEHDFTSVSSVQQVVEGKGDTYFYDSASHLLYFRYVQQRMSTLDFSQTPAFGTLDSEPEYYIRDGMRIPPMMWHGTIELRATGCALNDTNSNYCVRSDVAAANVCQDFGFPQDAAVVSYDACVVPTASGETSSPTSMTTYTIVGASLGGFVALAAAAAVFVKRRRARHRAVDNLTLPDL